MNGNKSELIFAFIVDLKSVYFKRAPEKRMQIMHGYSLIVIFILDKIDNTKFPQKSLITFDLK